MLFNSRIHRGCYLRGVTSGCESFSVLSNRRKSFLKNVSKNDQTIDKPVLFRSAGAWLAFVTLALINQELVTHLLDYLFGFSVTSFGSIYQCLLLATFVIALFLGFSKCAKIRLGKLDKPEIGYFQSISIIMCTLLAAGGVFWAAAEPLSHFLTVPPHFPDKETGTIGAVAPALATSFVDWGFLSWALLGRSE